MNKKEIEIRSLKEGNLFKLDSFGSPVEGSKIWFVWYRPDSTLDPEYRILLKTFSMNKEKAEASLEKLLKIYNEASLGSWDLKTGKFILLKKDFKENSSD